MYICPIENCKKTFESKQKLGGHISAHKRWKGEVIEKEKSISIEEFFCPEEGKYKCPHCLELYTKNGIGTHIWRKHGKGIDFKGDFTFGRTPWNKGLTIETDERVKIKGESLSQRYQEGSLIHNNKGIVLSEERKENLRRSVKRGITKRSKNEIYFSELCKELLKEENILENKKIFNGWDADIIIPHLKLAVLWNGAWHYEKVHKGHSLEQVQNRDKIKLKEIENFGYTTYIVKDMGSENKKFVKIEFEKFKEYISRISIVG